MRKRTLLLSLGWMVSRPSWALYDPPPNGLLLPAIGTWQGTLQYVDYQNPDRLVTLQTRLAVTLGKPDELCLYYTFDDGPGKTVYSYERMAFDLVKGELTWSSGVNKPSSSQYQLTLALATQDGSRFEFERAVDGGLDQYSLELKARSWALSKREARTGKPNVQRNKYEFSKT